MLVSPRNRIDFKTQYHGSANLRQRVAEGLSDLCCLAVSPFVIAGYYTAITCLRMSRAGARSCG